MRSIREHGALRSFMALSLQRAVLIYDAACPLCRAAAEWVARRADPDTIELLPCASTQRATRYPDIAEGACMQAVHVVLADGTVHVGEGALPHVLRLTPRWRWLAWAFALPGVSLASPFAYRWVARHRYALTAFARRKRW